MRTELDSLPCPVLNLLGGHQPQVSTILSFVPIIAPSQLSSYNVNDSAKSILPEDWQCKFCDIRISVIEGYDDRLLRQPGALSTPAEPSGKRDSGVSPARKPSHLLFETLG
jgi:hypothetical protein